MGITALTSTITFEGVKSGAQVAASHALPALKVVGSVAKNCFKFYFLYSMYESALSDILCLKTYRHGTNPVARLKISLTGPDLDKAGKEGEAAYYQTVTGQDSEWAARDQARKAFYVADEIITAKYYSLRSTSTWLCSMLPMPKSWKGNLTKEIVHEIESGKNGGTAILGLACPTVKFHYDPERVGSRNYLREDAVEFYKDTPDAGSGAYYTQDQLSAWDTGLIGILKNGINTRVFKRIQDNPNQFLWGVAQLVAAVAFTVLFFPSVAPGSQSIVDYVWNCANKSRLEQFKSVAEVATAIIFATGAGIGLFQL